MPVVPRQNKCSEPSDSARFVHEQLQRLDRRVLQLPVGPRTIQVLDAAPRFDEPHVWSIDVGLREPLRRYTVEVNDRDLLEHVEDVMEQLREWLTLSPASGRVFRYRK